MLSSSVKSSFRSGLNPRRHERRVRPKQLTLAPLGHASTLIQMNYLTRPATKARLRLAHDFRPAEACGFHPVVCRGKNPAMQSDSVSPRASWAATWWSDPGEAQVGLLEAALCWPNRRAGPARQSRLIRRQTRTRGRANNGSSVLGNAVTVLAARAVRNILDLCVRAEPQQFVAGRDLIVAHRREIDLLATAVAANHPKSPKPGPPQRNP